MKRAGGRTIWRVFPNAPHGFGVGIGTEAEGRIDDAISFWEKNMKNKKKKTFKSEALCNKWNFEESFDR